jgi:hypothetical protein
MTPSLPWKDRVRGDATRCSPMCTKGLQSSAIPWRITQGARPPPSRRMDAPWTRSRSRTCTASSGDFLGLAEPEWDWPNAQERPKTARGARVPSPRCWARSGRGGRSFTLPPCPAIRRQATSECSSHAREQARVIRFRGAVAVPPKRARAYGASTRSLLVLSERVRLVRGGARIHTKTEAIALAIWTIVLAGGVLVARARAVAAAVTRATTREDA